MAKMVDRVMTNMKDRDKIRNIAIAAHIDHGKTTFSDNLLSGAGMMSDELAGKALQLDFHGDEQERGITIDSSSVSMVHSLNGSDHLINLIDTPGHVDFGGDVTRAMRAVDGCIVLTCAVEGIMPQTETVLRQALKERVKPILFINKVDRLIKELKLTPEAMQERFVKTITEVNALIKKIAPPDFKDKVELSVADGSVCFGSAFHNWALSIPYMQKQGLKFPDIISAYENDNYKEIRDKAPLHEVILNAVIRHHPSPLESQKYRIPKIWGGDIDSPVGKSLIECDPNGKLMFVVTKMVVDPQAGEISAGRIFSGTIKKGEQVKLINAKQDARIQQVYIYNGAKKEIVPQASAGNIIGVGGLKAAFPGETVSSVETEPFEAMTHIFDPVVTVAIEAKKPADLPKLIDVLVEISKEDPNIIIEINQETGEHLLHGMGELHLEVTENRIKTEKKIEIETSPPIVVYRETVTRPSDGAAEGKSPNKHNKLYFKVEPLEESFVNAIQEGKLPKGRIKKKDKDAWEALQEAGMDAKESRSVREIFNGNMLIDGTRGIVQINEIIEMVMDMFEDVMKAGPVANEPCFGLKVTLDDAKLHEDAIHRGPAQVYPAVRDSIRAAMSTGNPVLFEPIQTLNFECPEDYMGEISKLISNKRGQLLDMTQDGGSIKVKGKLPVGEMFGLASDLRSATGGRGSSSVVDQSFERLPGELQAKLIKQIRQRKGLDSNE